MHVQYSFHHIWLLNSVGKWNRFKYFFSNWSMCVLEQGMNDSVIAFFPLDILSIPICTSLVVIVSGKTDRRKQQICLWRFFFFFLCKTVMVVQYSGLLGLRLISLVSASLMHIFPLSFWFFGSPVVVPLGGANKLWPPSFAQPQIKLFFSCDIRLFYLKFPLSLKRKAQ